MAVSAILVITLAASWTTPTQGSNSKFLTSPHHRTSLSSLVFEEDVMNAMGSMLGCGGQASPEKAGVDQKHFESNVSYDEED